MNFIDEVKIYAKAGNGGRGCASFRREKYVPLGGPDGGDGGKGGSVILNIDDSMNTLIDLRLRPHLNGEKGKPGSGNRKTGAGGKNLIVNVPLGTQIFNDKGEMLGDLCEVGEQYILALGGGGGAGNFHYKSSVNQSPKKYKDGEEGTSGMFILKMKILCDVGIIGFPNVGKSTLINYCAAGKSRVGDYPFTTLRPFLGVMEIYGKIIVLADLPGLVEGANDGVGLGHRFLKHIERCKVVLHLVDSKSEDVVHSYSCIRNELSRYNSEVAEKRELLALSRCDLVEDEEELADKVKKLREYSGKDVFTLHMSCDLGDLNSRIYNVLNCDVEKDEERKAFSPV